MRSRCRCTGWGVGVDRAEQNIDGCWMMMKNVILRGRGGDMYLSRCGLMNDDIGNDR